MGAAAAEPASPPLSSPPLRRQRSVASAIVSRCFSVLCCCDGDHFFTPLTPSPKDFNPQVQQQRQAHGGTWHDNWRLLGSRRARIAVPGPCDAEVVLSDGIYPKPGRWRILFRKLRAETRRMNCSRPSPPGFHYDALSYAMNFDDGSWQQQQQQSLYRSPSPAFMESIPPPTKLTVSSMS